MGNGLRHASGPVQSSTSTSTRDINYPFVPDVVLHDHVEHLDARIDGDNFEGGDQKLFDVARLPIHRVHLQPVLRKVVLQFVKAMECYNTHLAGQ